MGRPLGFGGSATNPTSVGFLYRKDCDNFHNVPPSPYKPWLVKDLMAGDFLPIVLFLIASTAVGVGMLALGWLLGPKRDSAVKEMPYESGMDPIHEATRRFNIRFHLVAI